MAKILLVEDDENLREIYQARLTAEGYEIVSAKNGEEALVVAKQEKPDLIIADIMMPRISGFEMLDILRNTEGMKHVRVIMLTALGQAEDKARADKLGADRYLVKSQVTLEDIVHAAADLLGDQAAPAAETVNQPAAQPAVTITTPAPVTPMPPVVSVPQPQNPTTLQTTPAPVPQPTTTPQPASPTPSTQSPATPMPAVATPPSPAPVSQMPVQQPVTTNPTTQPAPTSPATPIAAPTAPQNTPTPGVPPLAPTRPPQQINTAPQVPSQNNIQPTNSTQQNNASHLADAVNNLINGTASDQPVAPQPKPQPVAPSQPQIPVRPPQPQQPSTPRAFPTGAPTIPPSPAAQPASEPPKLAQPPVNVTQPQPTPPPTQPAPGPQLSAASIGIKDKKSVKPLERGQTAANADLNDLLKQETGQDSMLAANDGVQSDVLHQPGQVFMPTNGNSGSNDPNNIAL